MNRQRVHALIPAAGRSVRFGGTTLKQYAHLLGMPVMAHSIAAVERHDEVESFSVAEVTVGAVLSTSTVTVAVLVWLTSSVVISLTV